MVHIEAGVGRLMAERTIFHVAQVLFRPGAGGTGKGPLGGGYVRNSDM